MKTNREPEKRDWLLTFLCLVPALAIIFGISSLFKYLEFDSLAIVAVTLPAAFLAFVLLVAAINGRRKVIKAIVSSWLELLFIW